MIKIDSQNENRYPYGTAENQNRDNVGGENPYQEQNTGYAGNPYAGQNSGYSGNPYSGRNNGYAGNPYRGQNGVFRNGYASSGNSGNFSVGDNPYYDPARFAQLQTEKKELKFLSIGGGAATLLFFLFANILYSAYYMLSANANLGGEQGIVLSTAVDLIITLISLVTPFAIAHVLFKKRGLAPSLPLTKAKTSAKNEILFIIAGIGALLVGSYVTSYITGLFQTITGITFKYAAFEVPSSAVGLFVYYVRSALFPALAEEFAMRGVIMQPLRKYGDLFAVTMSSMVFALMHGNMIQTPFAFVAGFILGYAVIRTGSLWTSIIIHFVNNAFSLTQSVILEKVSESAAVIYGLIGGAVLVIAGAVAIAVLQKNRLITRFAPSRAVTPVKLRYRHYILTLPMIAAIIYMLVQTALMIDFSNFGYIRDFAEFWGME